MLARVRQFLPQIEQSNAELLQRDPRSIDIEFIEGSDEHVVEMASDRKSTKFDSANPNNEIRTWGWVFLNNAQREDTQSQVHPLKHHPEAWTAQCAIRRPLNHFRTRHPPQTLRTARI